MYLLTHSLLICTILARLPGSSTVPWTQPNSLVVVQNFGQILSRASASPAPHIVLLVTLTTPATYCSALTLARHT